MADMLPDFDKLWDYDHPAETERRFRELLPAAEKSGNVPYLLELKSQIARTLGLQRKFDEAHKVLDDVEPRLTPDLGRPRIRYLLERGRAFNSSKHPDKARPLFLEAIEIAQMAQEDNLAVDALHMMGIIDTPEKQIEWNEKAMALAEKSKDERTRRWLGSLYNNLGWTYHGLKKYDRALDLFRKGVKVRTEYKQEKELRIARWCVARCLRSMSKVHEALEIQESLLNEWAVAGGSDGYVEEELGECLLLLHKQDEAKPYFAAAYSKLSKDIWLKDNEPDRLNRLKELGGVMND